MTTQGEHALDDMLEKLRRDTATTKAADAIENARFRAVGQRSAAQCFFTSLALSLQAQPDWSVPTMATDGKRILFNPDFTNSLTPEECHGVACGHEPAHGGWMHFSRFPGLLAAGHDFALLNVAADLELNIPLKDAGFVLPKCACYPGQGDFKDCPPGLTMEEYVGILAKRPKNNQPQGGGGSDPGKCGGVIPAPDQATAEALNATWQGRVAAAAQEASTRGELPGSLRGFIDRVLKPKVNPWDVLREFLVRQAKLEQSWSKLNRRHLARGLYLPSKSGVQLGDVLCFIDCSGSMDEKQLAIAAGFMQDMLNCNPGKLIIAYHDYVLQGDLVEWEPGDGPLRFEHRGGGGTDHKGPMTQVLNSGVEPSVILCFTDMESSFPSDVGYPTIWVHTKRGSNCAPWGSYVNIAE